MKILISLLMFFATLTNVFASDACFESLLKNAEHCYYPEAQYEVAYRYYYGIGTEKDVKETRKWLMKAKIQDYEPALIFLELLDSENQISCQNKETANELLCKAFELNNKRILTFNTETGISKRGTETDISKLGTEIEQNFAPSYITISGGHDFENTIDFSDMYYEAELNLHLNWWNSPNLLNFKYKPLNKILSFLNENNKIRMYLPIRIQVRQLAETSSPVATPSYNPGLKIFWLNNKFIKNENDFYYFSIGFHHYSNGQSGLHYDPDTGQVNTENGSFSSDYTELSFYKVNNDEGLYDFLKMNIRCYFTNVTWEEEQTDYYEDFLIESVLKNKFRLCNRDAQLQLSVGYKFGRKHTSNSENFQYRAIFAWKPDSWEDLSLYARWDIGHDYYNINYRNKINRIQLGFVANAF